MDLRNTYIVSGLALVEHLKPQYVVSKSLKAFFLFKEVTFVHSRERSKYGQVPLEGSRCRKWCSRRWNPVGYPQVYSEDVDGPRVCYILI